MQSIDIEIGRKFLPRPVHLMPTRFPHAPDTMRRSRAFRSRQQGLEFRPVQHRKGRLQKGAALGHRCFLRRQPGFIALHRLVGRIIRRQAAKKGREVTNPYRERFKGRHFRSQRRPQSSRPRQFLPQGIAELHVVSRSKGGKP